MHTRISIFWYVTYKLQATSYERLKIKTCLLKWWTSYLSKLGRMKHVLTNILFNEYDKSILPINTASSDNLPPTPYVWRNVAVFSVHVCTQLKTLYDIKTFWNGTCCENNESITTILYTGSRFKPESYKTVCKDVGSYKKFNIFILLSRGSNLDQCSGYPTLVWFNSFPTWMESYAIL